MTRKITNASGVLLRAVSCDFVVIGFSLFPAHEFRFRWEAEAAEDARVRRLRGQPVIHESGDNLFNNGLRLNAPHPIYRVSLGMETRKHDDTFFFNDVEKRVGKLTQERAMNLFMHDGEGERASLDTR